MILEYWLFQSILTVELKECKWHCWKMLFSVMCRNLFNYGIFAYCRLCILCHWLCTAWINELSVSTPTGKTWCVHNSTACFFSFKCLSIYTRSSVTTWLIKKYFSNTAKHFCHVTTCNLQKSHWFYVQLKFRQWKMVWWMRGIGGGSLNKCHLMWKLLIGLAVYSCAVVYDADVMVADLPGYTSGTEFDAHEFLLYLLHHISDDARFVYIAFSCKLWSLYVQITSRK